jgi:2,4-dienoyl-CoA reductase-like NADH-dependent reductase (Old Yellow Enzyme family)/thioredoxin reductase
MLGVPATARAHPERTAMQLPRLFSPLDIGPVRIANRIVSSGHDTVMAEDGLPGDRLIAYHEARAAGGTGLIVVQVAGVHPSAKYTTHVLMADDDACVPHYARLAEAVHRHGTRIVQQLFHDGRELMESEDGTLPVALAPSAVPNERFHVMPRAMSVGEIQEMVRCYGDAARRMREAGFDGVEVVASHGYLPAQFLSPRTNLRTDEYGGGLDGRSRFLREVIAAVREAAGPDLAVGVRISVGEESPDGLTRDDSLEALRLVGPSLDYVSVVQGTSATLAGSDHIVPPMTFAPGYTAAAARAAKAVVDCPVVVAGRINQPQDAELILERGDADATVMTRALICDPEMPGKAEAGRLDEIRACIGCNQACIGHFHAGYPISCIQHPETGRELTYGVRTRAGQLRDVLVIGGGPGGLKAAAVAAERGHRVVLVERAKRLGGQVLLAQEVPGRAEFGGAITNLAGEAERAGVKILLGTEADQQLVDELDPDAVVVATGALPRVPELETADDPVVLTAWDLFAGAQAPAGHVVVADWRSDWNGLGAALRLAEQGRRVTLGVNGYHAGQRLQQYVRDAMVGEAVRRKVTILPLVRIIGADADSVYFQHVLTDEPVIVDGVSALVLAQGHTSVDGLLRELQDDARREVHGIGDCLAPRTVEEAVLDGLRTASAL